MKRGIICLVLVLIVSLNFVLASDLSLTVSDVNPSSVQANEDFTVGIQVWNKGNEDVKNVILEFKYLGEDLQLKENKTLNLGSLRKNGGMSNVVYHFHTSSDVVGGEREIKLKLSWQSVEGGNVIISKDYSFNVSIISDKPKITLSGIKTKPERVNQNQEIILTVNIENYGEGIAKNVRAELKNLNFGGVKEVYLGEIGSHEDLPARFILKSGKAGEYAFNMKVLYEFAGEEKERNFPLKIVVFNKTSEFLLITFALIIFIFVGIAICEMVKKKSKD